MAARTRERPTGAGDPPTVATKPPIAMEKSQTNTRNNNLTSPQAQSQVTVNEATSNPQDARHEHPTGAGDPPTVAAKPPIAMEKSQTNTGNNSLTSPQSQSQATVNEATSNPQDARHRISYRKGLEAINIPCSIIFQIAGLTTAIVFGFWAVKSYNISLSMYQLQQLPLSLDPSTFQSLQSDISLSNQISLLALCMNFADVLNAAACSTVESSISFPSLVSAVLPQTPTPTSTSGAPPTSSIPSLGFGGIIGIVFAVVTVIVLSGWYLAWRYRRKSTARESIE